MKFFDGYDCSRHYLDEPRTSHPKKRHLMAITAFIATRYPYDKNVSAQTHRQNSGSVSLTTDTLNNLFIHYNGVDTLNVKAIDFVVDYNDADQYVTIAFDGYEPPIYPTGDTGGIQVLSNVNPYRYGFKIPSAGAPDHKWEIGTPVFADIIPAPPWMLRVTVKRKSS